MSSDDTPAPPAPKARVRVPAGSQPSQKMFVGDGFQNLALGLGYGADTAFSQATHGFHPIGRQRVKMEWLYRSSWLVRRVVDCVAEDMTRAGLDIGEGMDPDQAGAVAAMWDRLAVWDRLREAIAWGRLYGGAVAVILIEGEDPSAPLRVEAVARGSFKGLLVLDRWMVDVSMTEFVTELGPDFGLPVWYNVIAQNGVPPMRIHHSRVIRFEGDPLPYWQRVAENSWSASVVEKLYDRLLAYDSATLGGAQLVHKSHLRTYKVAGYRELLATGGKLKDAFLDSVQLIRRMQSNEGLTVIDAEDDMLFHSSSVLSGMADALGQFALQLSGAAETPLVILFGQSPSGFNTGESDVRNYYDRITSKQRSVLGRPISLLVRLSAASLGQEPPDADLAVPFKSLWLMTEKERAEVAATTTQAVVQAVEANLISQKTAVTELRESANITGIFSNITDAEIDAASDEMSPPLPDEMAAMMGHNGGPPLDGGVPPPGAPGNPVTTPAEGDGPPGPSQPPAGGAEPPGGAANAAPEGPPGTRPFEHPAMPRNVRLNLPAGAKIVRRKFPA